MTNHEIMQMAIEAMDSKDERLKNQEEEIAQLKERIKELESGIKSAIDYFDGNTPVKLAIEKKLNKLLNQNPKG